MDVQPCLPLVCDESSASFVLDAGGGSLAQAERLPNGMLRAPAVPTRVGVLTYRFADGRTRRELRPPEEVFAKDSLDSLKMVPVTLEHPEPLSTPVTADNASSLSVGHFGDSLEIDGDLVRGTLMVSDSQAVRQVEQGERRELSAGYWRDLDPTPGVYRGVRYDAIQRNIRYNHVAITRRGRAGPEVRIRLDSKTAVLVGDATVHDDPPGGPPPMKRKITLDGITYELDCEDSTFQALERAISQRDEKLSSLDAELVEARKSADEQKARADSLEVEKTKLTAQVTDSTSPGRISELVNARLALERQVVPLLTSDMSEAERAEETQRLHGLEDAELKRRVVLRTDSEAELGEVSEDYLHGRFEQAVRMLTSDTYQQSQRRARESREDARRGARPGGAHPKPRQGKADQARARMIADTHNAWMKDLPEYEKDRNASSQDG